MSVGGWTWIASSDVALRALRPCFVNRPASATSARTNIQCDFIAELDRLERAAAVQWIAAIPARTSTGNVITLLLSELAYAAWIGAA